jgi:hypothetical protein
VPLPPGKKALNSRWVLHIKPDMHPTHTRLNARLVAKGFEQTFGLDYTETYAPVITWSTLCLVIAICVTFGWPIYHVDVVTAFLNGKLTEEIYMHQAPGFEVPGKEYNVCRLNLSIYGLRQSPRTWNTEIDTYLQQKGWRCSSADPNMSYLWKGKSLVILLIYDDDLLLSGNDKTLIDQMKDQLSQNYHMKDLGLIKRYLGVDCLRLPSATIIHQSDFATKILQDAGLEHCKQLTVPLPPGISLTDQMNSIDFHQFKYCHTVGQLLYLTNTRPDMSYAVSYVSRFMSRPQQVHWNAVVSIL